MATKLQAIEAQVMRLGPKSRAKLAERLIQSLDPPMDTALERIWVEEAERRVDEIRKGQVKVRPAAAVFRRIRRQVSRKRSRSTR
jgi:putative addiction module component (TIGR02574 family)